LFGAEMRRVVVTGMGIVSPVGNTVEGAWGNILQGKSGVDKVTRFDTSDLNSHIAGEVKDFDVEKYFSKKEARKFGTFVHYGVAAAMDAQADAGLEINDDNADRIGVAIGSGIGGMELIESNLETMFSRGPRRISPFYIPSTIVNMVAGQYSIMSGARGPNLCVVTACTTGAHNIGLAARSIIHGDADVMIAGGAESTIVPSAMGGFNSAKALSTRNDDPQGASRPWDAERDGFVMGEGAGVIVLEEYEHAKARGAKIYAEYAGFGMSGDAHHVTQPAAGGAGARNCMQNALRDAGMEPAEIDYINAHGTSTPAGDLAETEAVKAVFGADTKIPVSSTKSATGHLLGAAGGVEAIFGILALRDQVAPPTLNLDNPDPECDLDYVPHQARKMPIKAMLSNSFGFGGTNGSLIFKTAP
jgi:3-oxoacyl-[acyl-carrier-protein] synthase II